MTWELGAITAPTNLVTIDWDEDGHIEEIKTAKKGSEDCCLILKREYFQLNHIYHDVRKRIDNIIGKF
jgi:hypothetical protein